MWQWIKQFFSELGARLSDQIKQFFTRLAHGSIVSLLSLNTYYHSKKLLFLPLLAALSLVIVFALCSAGVLCMRSFLITYKYSEYMLAFMLILGLYFFIFLTNAFFQVVMAYAVDELCETGHARISVACWRSLKKMLLLIPWAAMEAVIKILTDKKERKYGATIWETSWVYLSFFIYPIFAFEQKTIFGSLKQSAELMKKYFGTVTGSIVTFSALGQIGSVIMLGVVFIFQGIAWIARKSGIALFFNQYFILGFLLFEAFCMMTIFFYIIEFVSMAKTMTSTLLYRHINEKSTGFLKPEVLEAAIQEIK